MSSDIETAGPRHHALVLAAGRGPDDPLARAFSVSHKCLIPVGGTPMLARVFEALAGCASIASITVSIDRPEIARALAEETGLSDIRVTQSASSAPASVIDAVERGVCAFPLLVTTADHALLDRAMLDHFLDAARDSGADLAVGLASAETILAAHPGTKRTFLDFAGTRYSGCNLFALSSRRALPAIAFWDRLDNMRKRPLRIVRAFGLKPLILYALGRLTLERAFDEASRRLGLAAHPVIMPFAEAAIDVDKPEDKALVEEILASRYQD